MVTVLNFRWTKPTDFGIGFKQTTTRQTPSPTLFAKAITSEIASCSSFVSGSLFTPTTCVTSSSSLPAPPSFLSSPYASTKMHPWALVHSHRTPFRANRSSFTGSPASNHFFFCAKRSLFSRYPNELFA
uniref:Uncharacterized protein n=1 Tax=Mesocestoides corti TaxID=53468 RepID=A0A5K3G1G9_MESCO